MVKTRLAVALAALAVSAVPVLAQDASLGRSIWLTESNCNDCHGWFGTGEGEDPRSPRGANLRATPLDAAGLAEVIMCGRPATAMPHFDPRAYTDKRCYDVTKADLGDRVPPDSPQQLTRRQIDALAAFIAAEFKGRGDPTQEECVALLGSGSSRCATMPKAK